MKFATFYRILVICVIEKVVGDGDGHSFGRFLPHVGKFGSLFDHEMLVEHHLEYLHEEQRGDEEDTAEYEEKDGESFAVCV